MISTDVSWVMLDCWRKIISLLILTSSSVCKNCFLTVLMLADSSLTPLCHSSHLVASSKYFSNHCCLSCVSLLTVTDSLLTHPALIHQTRSWTLQLSWYQSHWVTLCCQWLASPHHHLTPVRLTVHQTPNTTHPSSCEAGGRAESWLGEAWTMYSWAGSVDSHIRVAPLPSSWYR